MSPQNPGEAQSFHFHPKPSALAIVLTMILVAGAILFGIYGPHVAGRLTTSGGIPLVDAIDAAAELRAAAIQKCWQDNCEENIHREEARGRVQQWVGRSADIPDLAPLGYHLRRITPASLPGAAFRGAVALYRGTDSHDGRWIALFFAADDGQYLSFDELGRPQPLDPRTSIRAELGSFSEDEAIAMIWSDGQVLRIACMDDEHEADRVREALGTP